MKEQSQVCVIKTCNFKYFFLTTSILFIFKDVTVILIMIETLTLLFKRKSILRKNHGQITRDSNHGPHGSDGRERTLGP